MISKRRGLSVCPVLLALATVTACSTTERAEDSSSDRQVEQTQTTDDSAKNDRHAQGESDETSSSSHGHEEGGDEKGEEEDHPGHQKKKFKNPEKLAQEWNAPERDEWQRPEAVVDAMNIEKGMSVADIGAGTGYFIPYLADPVGASGTVFAVDIEQSMLDYIGKLADERDIENVETVLAEQTDSNLEKNSVDRILIVDTWHHIPDRGDYAEHLRERLKEGGSVWIVDFQHDSPVGPPKKHRLDPQQVVDELEKGGFDAEVHDLELDRQYLVVGRTD